jgi:hypothetical protein
MHPTVLAILLLLRSDAAQDDLASKTLEKLNSYRQAAGLKAVVLDADLSKACLAHAQYITKHLNPAKAKEFNPHVEDPRLAAYTKEGQKAAKNSLISAYFGKPNPLGAGDSFMAGLFHRVPLLHPDLERVGFAHVQTKANWGVIVLDSKSGRRTRSAEAAPPVNYPVDQQANVPLAFSQNEIPNPIPPEGRGQRAGFPITVTFPESAKVTQATAVLKDGSGREVAGWLSSPEKPAFKPHFQNNTICLIPKAQLRPKTTYQVAVTAQVNGKAWQRTWRFTTK